MVFSIGNILRNCSNRRFDDVCLSRLVNHSNRAILCSARSNFERIRNHANLQRVVYDSARGICKNLLSSVFIRRSVCSINGKRWIGICNRWKDHFDSWRDSSNSCSAARMCRIDLWRIECLCRCICHVSIRCRNFSKS